MSSGPIPKKEEKQVAKRFLRKKNWAQSTANITLHKE